MITTIHKGESCNFVKNSSVTFSNPIINSGKKKQTIFFKNAPSIIGRMAVVGEKEGRGPIGKYFQRVENDIKMGEKCFEKAEIKMLELAIHGAMKDADISVKDLDLLLSGDLLNQITSSNYAARALNVPHLGLYSACSTMSECLAIGACFVNAGYYDTVACATASHFATAERQFRYPLEYGCQRPPYAQWTVTGAGCSIISNKGIGPKITMATLGKVVDFGTNDLSNMGAAMAPAALDTIKALFTETNTSPNDYDLILTGDLGKLGSDIFRDLTREQGYDLGQKYIDCGCLIYSSKQNCYQGGSGCACSAAVFNSFILDKMEKGEYNKVIYLATGALMSTQSCYQGETIPSVSHAVVIER